MGLNGYKPQKRNANRHNVKGLKALDDSIQRDGFIGAITTAADGEVFAGSARLERSADIFGIEIEPIVVHAQGDRPIIVVRDDIPNADDPKAKRLAVADNVVQRVDWSPDIEILAELAQEDAAIANLLKQDDELAALLAKGEAQEETADAAALVDKAAELQKKWKVERGDVWQIGKHRLMCGDSTSAEDVGMLMGGEKAQAVVSDVPYGMDLDTDWSSIEGSLRSLGAKNHTRGNKYEQVIGDDKPFDPAPLFEMFGYCKEMFLFGGDYYAEKIPNRVSGSWLAWDKRKESQADAIGAEFELIWSKAKHKRRMLRHDWFGFLSSQNGKDARNRQHPTQKPASLIVEILNQWIGEGAIVFDGYVGSGTTLVACEQTGRIGRGMEIEPKYCAVTLERLSLLGLNCERVNG